MGMLFLEKYPVYMSVAILYLVWMDRVWMIIIVVAALNQLGVCWESGRLINKTIMVSLCVMEGLNTSNGPVCFLECFL